MKKMLITPKNEQERDSLLKMGATLSCKPQSTGYVATYTFWEDVTILCCGFDEALVEKKGYEIAKKRKLRNFKANIDVIETEAT